jgi:dolichol-phosphate mannosyltransferase
VRSLIVIPTYNEIENITLFIQRVFDIITKEKIDAHILVVDDNSPDGTASVVEALRALYSECLHLLKRPEKQGLGSAYVAGFQWGISRGYELFLEMDADFSHNPKYIPEMFDKIQTSDVVIGSRYVASGGVENWGLPRKIISRGGSIYAGFALSCPIKDLTGGFNLWRKTALDAIGLDSIISKGFSFQVEMKFKAFHSGCVIVEIPIIFVDRKLGSSKMSKKIFLEALFNVGKIKRNTGAENAVDQFIKFFITGGLGAITNLALFFLSADIAGLPVIPTSVGCFLVSGTQNYFFNHRWSFKKNMINTPLSFKKWLLYLSASLFGLTVNIAVMRLTLFCFTPPYKFIAQACGIAAGMFVNFMVSKLIVFRRKKQA